MLLPLRVPNVACLLLGEKVLDELGIHLDQDQLRERQSLHGVFNQLFLIIFVLLLRVVLAVEVARVPDQVAVMLDLLKVLLAETSYVQKEGDHF